MPQKSAFMVVGVAAIMFAMLLPAAHGQVDVDTDPPTPPPARQSPSDPSAPSPAAVERPLAGAPLAERDVIDKLLNSDAWMMRAIGLLRLERFTCEDARAKVIAHLDDSAWQMRALAARWLGRARVAQQPAWFAKEGEPRVLRAAMRNGFSVDAERLGRGVRFLSRSSTLTDKMLAAELAAASNDAELHKTAQELVRTIILRMQRTDAGELSPRLAQLTGQPSLGRPSAWQHWMRKAGRTLPIRTGSMLARAEEPPPLSRIAQLESEPFIALEEYMRSLRRRQLDLAIAIDCTASMDGELAAAQGGIDDLVRFVADTVADVRIALVAYRDRKDEFEAKAWDFTPDVDRARQALWSLSADGGGDGPESVHEALEMAFMRLDWRRECAKTLVLVGDAPPHVGLGTRCVQLAQAAYDQARVTTHCIQASKDPVKHFPEIAAAGHGQCVTLEHDDALVAEIAGLALADRFEPEFREFFAIYLEICR